MEGLAQHKVDYTRQVRPGVHAVLHGGDEGLHVEFYMKSIKMEFESEKAGRYIGKDVPFIRILFPGDKTKSHDRPAKLKYEDSEMHDIPLDNERFPRQWNAFSNQQEQVQSGTPLEEWSILNKSEVLGLKSINVHTVDQLAAAPDTALTWLGARELRKKAVAFLEQAKNGGAISSLIAENENLKNDIQFLKDQIIELGGKTEKKLKKSKGE